MKEIKIYPIKSILSHGGMISKDSESLLNDLSSALKDYSFKVISSIKEARKGDFLLILIQSGGSEGIFKSEVFPNYEGPYYLLTYGSSNSLAASLEILTFLHQNGKRAEVLHGDNLYIQNRIEALYNEKKSEKPYRLGVFGEPSDWLISSFVDYKKAKDILNVDLIDIKESEVIENILSIDMDSLEGVDEFDYSKEEIRKALRIYEGLKKLVAKYELDAFTIRCFDILSAAHSSACLALALFNKDGIVASCEGDVPSLLTAFLMQKRFSWHCFQANPQWIDPLHDDIHFAHCTLPLDMATSYCLDTHFESGIGVGIHGELPKGPITVLKINAEINEFYCEEGELTENEYRKDRCRTQIKLHMHAPVTYFLSSSLGNHHQILFGHHKKEIKEYLLSLGLRNVTA